MMQTCGLTITGDNHSSQLMAVQCNSSNMVSLCFLMCDVVQMGSKLTLTCWKTFCAHMSLFDQNNAVNVEEI